MEQDMRSRILDELSRLLDRRDNIVYNEPYIDDQHELILNETVLQIDQRIDILMEALDER